MELKFKSMEEVLFHSLNGKVLVSIGATVINKTIINISYVYPKKAEYVVYGQDEDKFGIVFHTSDSKYYSNWDSFVVTEKV